MTLKPTDLRKTPFEISNMISLSNFELNISQLDFLEKTRQNMKKNDNNFRVSQIAKQLLPLIEDEQDRLLFIEMIAFFIYLKNNDNDNSIGNIYFNNFMSLDLKEKFSSASKINIPYLTYIFAFKFNFLHINWLKTFTKLFDLIKLINNYLIENIQTDEKISNVLHLMIIPLNIYSKEKSLQNSYCFCIGINEISHDLIFFLEEFRNSQYARLQIPDYLKPATNLQNFPIILLNFMQTMRKILLKNSENSHYKEIKSLFLKEVELLFQEHAQIQTKLIELKIKLDKFENCKVFIVDISEVDENYFDNFFNKQKLFFSIFQHVSEYLLQDIVNLSYCCHAFKGLLLITFQWTCSKKEIFIQMNEFSKKLKIIIKGLYEILSMKYPFAKIFFKPKEKLMNLNNNNEIANDKNDETHDKIKIINKNLVENMKYFNVNKKSDENLKVLSERIYAFRDEKWVQLIFLLCKKMDIILPLQTSLELISALEILSRIEKIKFLQNEIFNHYILSDYEKFFQTSFEIIQINGEFELFFFRIFSFLLENNERLVEFIGFLFEVKIQQLVIEITFYEIFNEFSNDFYNLTDFAQTFFRSNVGTLITEYFAKGILPKENIVLFLLSNYFNSSYLKDFFHVNYIEICEKTISEKEINEILIAKTSNSEMLKLFYIVAFDVDNIQIMDYNLKVFFQIMKNTISDYFVNENGKDELNLFKFLGLLYVYSFFYSFYDERLYQKINPEQEISKRIKIKKCLEKLLFEKFDYHNELNLYVINFISFLKEDIGLISRKLEENKEYRNTSIFLMKSRFMNCNCFLLRSQSLSVILYVLKRIKEITDGELSHNLIKLKEFIWSYPKLDLIEAFLKEHEGKIINLNFNKFLDENILYPLTFENSDTPIKSKNLEIINYLKDSQEKFGCEFLNDIGKINPNLKINNIEIGKFLEISQKKNKKKPMKSSKIEEYTMESKPDQKILDKNPYNPLTKEINFYKIDKKVAKLSTLIEIMNIYLTKGKVIASDGDIEKMIKNVNKNFEEIYNYKLLCESSQKDIMALDETYEKFRNFDI